MDGKPDRRVLRSRAALMEAAVRLVSERGVSPLSVTDLAEAANVSRQLVYLQFGNRDALLVAAAANLVERELLPDISDPRHPHRKRLVAMGQHFASHQSFYRAMLTGPCAYPMTLALNDLFSSLVSRAGMRDAFGELDDTTARDITAMIVGGTASIVNHWLIDSNNRLDAEDLANRLLHVSATIIRGYFPA